MKYAEGSCLIAVGHTRVLCAASIEERVPQWMKGRGTGWVTAEYAMLPRATQERTQREASRGRVGGRTHEIQRIIGRALRAVTDMAKLGERTVWLDCDVLQADGGTRTAAVTGAWVALTLALLRAFDPKDPRKWPLAGQIAATSVGFVAGYPLLDLAYDEDSRAEVDMNVFMTDSGTITEVQGTAEAKPFSRSEARHAAGSGAERNTNAARGAVRDRADIRLSRRRGARKRRDGAGLTEDAFHALVARVAEFYITDKAMKTAQRTIETALASGTADAPAREQYVAAVRRYFGGFEREARVHLRDVDKRLEQVNQVHFNLTAERGVAVRRIEATQAVLQDVERVASAERV